jgi:hypothetical protein
VAPFPPLGFGAAGLFMEATLVTCVNLPRPSLGRLHIAAQEGGGLEGRALLYVDSLSYLEPNCNGPADTSSYFVHYEGAVAPNCPLRETLVGANGFNPSGASFDLYMYTHVSGWYEPYRATAIIDRVVFEATSDSAFANGFEN